MSFVSDFQKLYWSTPQVQNWTRQSENCDYGDIIVVSKNCFLCFNSSNLENCHYCHSSNQNYDCNGLMFCSQCNLCYECIDSLRCYNCNYLEWCENLTDSSHCYNCKSLSNCTGCVNLFHKEYCLFNEQLTKEEYEKKLKEIKIEKIEEEFEKLKLKYPRNYMHQTHSENCCGDYVVASKNCYWIFDSRDCEDSFYVTEALLEHGCKDCCDCGPIANTFAECYDCCHSGFLHNCSHVFWSDRLADCHWCSNLWDSQYCFGCVYAKSKKYQILNKQYEKEEYLKLVEKHKKELKEANIQDLCDIINFKL